MTYPEDTHSHLSSIRQSIATQASTFVLLPSLDLQECVTETVRRQRHRPLARHRSDRRAEDVIRERFPVYMALPARKVPTMREPADVAAEIVTFISAP
jgi:shikimate kinase